MFMYLDELLKGIDGLKDVPHMEITHLSCDSRTVQPGCLFFALPGTNVDGSRFIAEAVKGGASAIVQEVKEDKSVQIPQIQVSDARLVLAEAASRFYGHPTKDYYLCGITGTNGKTTLTYLLENIWSAKNTGVIGTVNYRYNNKIFPAPLTTPDSITMQKIFAEMSKEDMTTVVIEASSHALEQKRVHGCEIDSAVFTNLTQDHLDYHGDMESYFSSKKILFHDVLPNSSKKEKLVVINLDDPYGRRLKEELDGKDFEVKTFSIANKEADLFVDKVQYSIQETEAILCCNGEKKKIKTNLLGEHNLRNILAAILVGLHRKINLDEILDNLQSVEVPGRLQRVLNTNCFVDYAHTPDALINVLSSLKEIMKSDPQTKRLIVVFGCGGDRDKRKRSLMGEAVARLADLSLVTSDNPRTEDPAQIIDDILPGVTPHQNKFDGKYGFLVEVDRRKALHKVIELADKQDVVVVAGKGHEDYQIIGTDRIHFDDSEILTELINATND